jgi:hypothetical protein
MIEILDKTHNSCYVKKAGFEYPIRIHGLQKFKDAVSKLCANESLGQPAREYHYTTLGGQFSIRHIYSGRNIENAKWYAGARHWNSSSKNDNWIVFKNEKDRTVALILIS